MDLVERALDLWTEPIPAGDAGQAAFRAVYADPLLVNGTLTPLADVVSRARMLQGALDGLKAEVLDKVETEHRIAFAFRMSGRHRGALATPLGDVPPTGHDVSVLGMDILQVADGLITGVWAVADLLGPLAAASAVRLTSPT